MLELKTAPASLAQMLLPSVLDHLRRYHDLDAEEPVAPPDLAYIELCTEAAVARLDGPQGKLGRVLLTQTWVKHFPRFDGEMPLGLPPVQSVVSVKYRDRDGYVQTLGASKYRLVQAASWDPAVVPAKDETWPETQSGDACIRIEFIAGFGDAADDIPADLAQAIRVMAAHYYQEREPVTFTTPHEIPMLARDLIQPYRIYR